MQPCPVVVQPCPLFVITCNAGHDFDTASDILARFDELKDRAEFHFVPAYFTVHLRRGMETGLQGTCAVAVTMGCKGGLSSLVRMGLGEDPGGGSCQGLRDVAESGPRAGHQSVTQRQEVHVCPCFLVVVESELLNLLFAWSVHSNVVGSLHMKIHVIASQLVVVGFIQ